MQAPFGYFDGRTVEMERGSDESAVVKAAWQAVLALSPADRQRDSRHVHAYYRDYHEAVGGKDWLDAEIGVPATPEDIWDHVTPGAMFVMDQSDDTQVWIGMEAECAWEAEHGLLLVWDSAGRLVKTGGFDGHATNDYAYDDDSMADVVYAASNPANTTRRDG